MALRGIFFDAYAIRISHVSVEELATRKDDWDRFYRGDQLPPTLNEAVKFAGAWLKRDRTSGFPPSKRSEASTFIFTLGPSDSTGISVEGAELIFVRPTDNMVFYFSCET